MKVYPENDGVEFTAWFESVPGVPTVPPTVHWRLIDVGSETVLYDWTEVAYEIITDASGAMTGVRAVIDIDGALNGLVDDTNRRETKQLQVVAAKDTSRQRSKFHDYAISRGIAR